MQFLLIIIWLDDNRLQACALLRTNKNQKSDANRPLSFTPALPQVRP